MKDIAPARVVKYSPMEHIRRAETLTSQVDNYWRHDGEYVGPNVTGGAGPLALDLARLHLQLAQVKVASGKWSWSSL